MYYVCCVFALFVLNINLSHECALPFWWTEQYHFQPYYQITGTPKTTYRYRETIHRSDPNNYVHVKEYSEYTWWEHDSSSTKESKLSSDDINHMTNVIFSKDGSINGIIPGKRGVLPQNEVRTNLMPEIPRIIFHGSDDTNGIVPGKKNAGSAAATTVDLNPPRDFNNEFFSRDGQTKSETTQKETQETTVPDTTVMTTVEDKQTTPDVTENEAAPSERETNENEDVEKVSEELNDLEASGAAKSSSQLKIKEPKSKGSFLSGWFGKKISNETEPCKVSETDIHSLRSMIEKMFSFPREHVVNPESKEKAREDILNKFRNYGLQVWTQNFTTPPMKHANGSVEFDEGVNLVGVIPGSQRGKLDDEIVLVGAHYDTVADSNGVDDNGSGLAVMLEIARTITEARCRLNHTLMFVAFDHEENGAMGSNHFVDHYLIPDELKRARARFQGAFILDGIMNYNDVPNTQELPLDYTESLPGFQYFVNNTGNRGNFLALISRNEVDNHLSKKLMDSWQDLGDHQYKLFNLAVDMGNAIPDARIIQKHLNFLRSDHATFWYHNSSSHFPESLNAVLLTDTGPFRGQMKECYHNKCDDLTVITPEKLQFAKKTADALTATLVELTSATAAGCQIHASWITTLFHIITLYLAIKCIK